MLYVINITQFIVFVNNMIYNIILCKKKVRRRTKNMKNNVFKNKK